MEAAATRTIGVNDIAGPDADRIKRIVAENRAKPTESDFKGKPGFWRQYRADGSYEWGWKYQPNDGHGKLTKASHEVLEMMRPSMQMQQNRIGGPGQYPGLGLRRKRMMIARGSVWMRATADGSWHIGGTGRLGQVEHAPDGVTWQHIGDGVWEVVA